MAITVSSFGPSGQVFSAALKEFGACAEKEFAAIGVPGMAFCLVDAEGFVAIGTYGWADMDRRIPMQTSHLLQLGSISKSLAALCVYRLVHEGKVDLNAPLSNYLDIPLPDEPIAVRHLLSHTSGLPRGSPVFPHVPGGRLWTGFTPGDHFAYSNSGYDLIGALVEKVTGKPYPMALRELIIQPLGIEGMREVIQASDRARYAVGYSPLDASGPNMTMVPLGQTPWIDLDTPAGNIAATMEAMPPFLRYLIDVGRGRGAPLFSDAVAKRFRTVSEPAASTAAVALFGEGAAYANGLAVIDLEGRPAFHHIGGTFGFSASMTVDYMTGVACLIVLNVSIAGYRAAGLCQYGCRLLRHAKGEGVSPSPPLEATLLNSIDHAEDYAGTYIGPDGDRFQLQARSNHLFLITNDNEGRIQSAGGKFLCDHPRFRSHFLDFERREDKVVATWFGGALYGRGTSLRQPFVPPQLEALRGSYVSNDPLTGGWRSIIVQDGRLVIENVAFFRSSSSLHQEGDYWFPDGTETPCERIRFEALMDGAPQRLNVSGRNMWRFCRIESD